MPNFGALFTKMDKETGKLLGTLEIVITDSHSFNHRVCFIAGFFVAERLGY